MGANETGLDRPIGSPQGGRAFPDRVPGQYTDDVVHAATVLRLLPALAARAREDPQASTPPPPKRRRA